MRRRPVPLMFIKSPSVILQRSVGEEESTSIFVKDESSETVEKPISDKKKVLPSVENQLKKMASPFGRHLYKPVRIRLANGQEVFGNLEQIDNEQMTMQVEDEVVAIEKSEVADILWRGKSIPEK